MVTSIIIVLSINIYPILFYIYIAVMPPKKAGTTKRRKPRAMARSKAPTAMEMEGAGIIRDIAKYVKKHKLVSKGARIADILGVPHASKVARAAKFAGVGKGAGLKPPGQGLTLPGGANSRKPRKRRAAKKK